VKEGDILIGKITPERRRTRLLKRSCRAIFGDKAGDEGLLKAPPLQGVIGTKLSAS
jgi:DNA-directed RNA polymerase beta subunit